VPSIFAGKHTFLQYNIVYKKAQMFLFLMKLSPKNTKLPHLLNRLSPNIAPFFAGRYRLRLNFFHQRKRPSAKGCKVGFTKLAVDFGGFQPPMA